MTLPLLLRLASSSSWFRRPFGLLAFTFSTTSPPNPPPIRVSLTDSLGRAVFATRPIPTGDLIHTAEPAVCHPSLSSLHPVCYSCLATLPNLSSLSPFCSHRCHQRSKVRFIPLQIFNQRILLLDYKIVVHFEKWIKLLWIMDTPRIRRVSHFGVGQLHWIMPFFQIIISESMLHSL
jgi:hypothetical protein